MDGVLDTRSGWIGPHEVVTVRFDPRTIPYEELLDVAIEKDCAARAWWTTDAQAKVARAKLKGAAEALGGAPRDAKKSDQVYYIERTDYAALPLTPLQARRVNGALYTRQDPKQWLSPRQVELAERLSKAPEKVRAAARKLGRPGKVEELAKYQRRLEELLSKAR